MRKSLAYISAMAGKQKTMTAIILLITVALAGMVWMQIILLKKAFALAEQAFTQNVNTALSSMVGKLEDRETVSRVFSAMVKPMPFQRVLAVQAHVDEDSLDLAGGGGAWQRPLAAPPVHFDPKTRDFSFTLSAPKRVRLRILDSLGRPLQAIIDEMKPPGDYHVQLDSTHAPGGDFIYNFNLGTDSSTYDVVFMGASQHGDHARWFSNEGREKIIHQVLDELTMIKRKPIESRIQAVVLDSIVQMVLQAQGLRLAHGYGVMDYSGPRDSLKFATPAVHTAELQATPFRARLFPTDPLYQRSELVLYFPDQDLFLLKKNGGLLASVFVLLSIIVFCFVYTLRTLFMQKQFARALMQFINNMTHEFKTPISTIALASDAFKNPQVSHDPEKIQRYSGIILDESQRMRSQVEKILQMAVLEEGDYELNLSTIDVHQLLSEALHNFTLQVEKRKGEIVRQFHATRTTIEADAVHFANIIHNLLDNANKYTPATPRIVVSTENDAGGVHFKIADNGVGLRPEEKKLVFDKYYRVPTGNVHDVKGFGLGLSYVKLMVEAHGGAVEVESEFRRGSAFHVFMPYVCSPPNMRKRGAEGNGKQHKEKSK
ncbi:MAG: sensor histidine kinase [bacterium]